MQKYENSQNCFCWVSKISPFFVLDSKNAQNPVKMKIHCCFAYMFYRATVENDYFLFKTDPNNMRKLLHRNQKKHVVSTEIGLSTIQLKFWTKSPGATTQKSLKHPNTWFFNPMHFDSTYESENTNDLGCKSTLQWKFQKIYQNWQAFSQLDTIRGENKVTLNKYQLIHQMKWLIDNIYVVCGDCLFRRVIGIPMGTDCAPF